MSANPAASIFVRMELLKQQIMRDMKALPGELQSAVKGTAVKIPVEILSADVQAKLDKALASIKVKPINVPVNFVPTGMPGGIAGAGGAGAGPAAMPGVGPNAAPGAGGGSGSGGGMGGGGMFRTMFAIHGVMALANAMGRRDKEAMDLERTMTYGSGDEKNEAMKNSVKQQYEQIHANKITT